MRPNGDPWEPGPTSDETAEGHGQTHIFGGPIIQCLANVREEQVQWLWPNRIPLKKLTLITGDPGGGKSTLTLDLAARITCGRDWPDGSLSPQGSVILLSSEDDAADTIVPRLRAAKADLGKVHILKAIRNPVADNGQETMHLFSLADDIIHLEKAIEQVGDVQLIVLDPVSSYLGQTDSHRNAEVRGILLPLADLAQRHEVAIILISHLNKSANMSALHRNMGSIAFTAAVRAGWIVAKDKQDENRRLFLSLKSNLGPEQCGLAYRLIEPADGIGVACVAWEPGEVRTTADEALSQSKPGGSASPATEEAADWLSDVLRNGPKAATEIKSKAEADGISERSLNRGKKSLNLACYREGYGEYGKWIWELPRRKRND